METQPNHSPNNDAPQRPETGSTDQSTPAASQSVGDDASANDTLEEMAQSEIGPELYDYGSGGGPDASSSGLRSTNDDAEE